MAPQSDPIYSFDAFILDVRERRLLKNGASISLTPKAFDVLTLLVERAGHLVDKEELLHGVWPDSFVEEANVSRVIHTLRRTLGQTTTGEPFIQTVSKSGYRFTRKVTVVSREDFRPSGQRPSDLNLLERPSRWLAWAAVLFVLVVLLGGGGFLLHTGQTRSMTFDAMVPIRVTASGDVHGPDVSPDGTRVVYIKQSEGMFGLQVMDQATGDVRDLVKPVPGIRYWGIRFNNDGQHVYYVENRNNDNGTLYRLPSTGGDPLKIASNVSGGAKTAPDGKRILFVRVDKKAGTNWLMICDAEGGNERVLTESDTDHVFMSADWSPDGSSITYVLRNNSAGNSTYSIIDKQIESGRERILLGPGERSIIAALWMPDRERLVINAIDETSTLPQIFLRDLRDGTEKRVTNDLGYYYHLSLTADGRSILTQKIEQDRYIWLQRDVGTTEASQITFEKDQHFDAVDWLDSDTLVFDPDFNGSHKRRNLWTLNIGAAKPVPLTEGPDDNTRPRVAPNGGSITYISNKKGDKQLWRMGADASNPLQVTNIPNRIYEHAYSPDGRWIYFQYSTGGEGKLVRMPVEGGEISEVGGREFFDWSLSPDGTKIAYRTLDEPTGKYLIKIRAVDDPLTLETFLVEAYNHLVWSKNGEFLYYVADTDLRKNIYRQPVAGGVSTPVTDFRDAEILNFAESPDGKSLAIIRSTTSFDAVRFDFQR